MIPPSAPAHRDPGRRPPAPPKYTNSTFRSRQTPTQVCGASIFPQPMHCHARTCSVIAQRRSPWRMRRYRQSLTSIARTWRRCATGLRPSALILATSAAALSTLLISSTTSPTHHGRRARRTPAGEAPRGRLSGVEMRSRGPGQVQREQQRQAPARGETDEDGSQMPGRAGTPASWRTRVSAGRIRLEQYLIFFNP